jgi:AraC-like DNA-binding protein
MSAHQQNAELPVIRTTKGELLDILQIHGRRVPGPIPVSELTDTGQLLADGSIFAVWKMSDRCFVGIRDLLVNQDFVTDATLDNYLSIEYFLSGGVDIQRGDIMLCNNSIPRIHLSSHTEGGRLVRYFHRGDQFRGLGLWIDPKLFSELYGLDFSNASPAIASILRLETDDAVVLPLCSAMQQVVASVITSPYTDKLGEQFLQAKLTELLCYTTEFLASDNLQPLHDMQLSRPKREAMRRVIAILDEQFHEPPKLCVLASEVGLSRSALTTTFKNTFALTIGEYIQRKRMETARQLLAKGSHTILDIAVAVGFEDQSAFSRAYRRHFNCTPKADRVNP